MDCINSVLEQSYTLLELILIDDGSIDGSFELIQEIKQADKRIRINRTSHVGQGAARNIGIKMSKGDYILFLDSDDYWNKDYLEKLSEIICLNKADIYVGNQHNNLLKNKIEKIIYYSSEEFNSITEKDGKVAYFFEEGNKYPGATWNNVYKRHFIMNNDIEFGNYRMSQDTDFMFTAIEAALEIVSHNIEFYFYRKDNIQSVTNTISYKKLEDRLEMLRKWYFYYLKKSEKNRQLLTVSNRLAAEYFDTFLLTREIKQKDGKREFLKKAQSDKAIWEKAKGKKRQAIIFIMKLFGVNTGILLLNKYNGIRMKK